MNEYKPVKLLNTQTANKIAAGEVIERPASVVRELLDNSIDAGANSIKLEIEEGGIKKIRITDDGCGMSKEDLEICTETHSTSKISDIKDLLSVSSLGFRGEALSSIKAVSNLEITTTRNGPVAWKLSLGKIEASRLHKGTVVSVENLFENFPARKQFLKRAGAEAKQCKQIFVEKAMAHPKVAMTLNNDSGTDLNLPAQNSFKERCLEAQNLTDLSDLFYEVHDINKGFSFTAVLGLPDIVKHDRRYIYIFVNGRRITDYGLVQAVEYGAGEVFPNGGHPVAFVFLTVDPLYVDFNIHPAKKEARFTNYSDIHSAISSTVGKFYRQHTIAVLNKMPEPKFEDTESLPGFTTDDLASRQNFSNYETRKLYAETVNTPPATYSGSSATSIPQNRPVFTPNYTTSPPDLPKPSFRFLGQVAGTFIAVEKNNALYLVDQHAAHERIIFDELTATAGEFQELLVPYKIETDSDAEDLALKKNQEQLNKAGFKIKQEGTGVWIVSSVPVRWKGSEQDLHNDLRELSNSENIMHDVLAMSACKSACKDGDILDPTMAYKIVEKAFALPEPVCPHGRPLWIIIDRDELFKRIKRT